MIGIRRRTVIEAGGKSEYSGGLGQNDSLPHMTCAFRNYECSYYEVRVTVSFLGLRSKMTASLRTGWRLVKKWICISKRASRYTTLMILGEGLPKSSCLCHSLSAKCKVTYLSSSDLPDDFTCFFDLRANFPRYYSRLLPLLFLTGTAQTASPSFQITSFL